MGLSTGFIFALLCSPPVLRPSVLSIIVLGILKQSVQSDVRFALKLHVVHHQLCVPEARQQPVSYQNPRFPHHLTSWLALPLFFPISVSITPIPPVQAKNPTETHLGFSHIPFLPFMSSMGRSCSLAMLLNTAWLLSSPPPPFTFCPA